MMQDVSLRTASTILELQWHACPIGESIDDK